MTERPLDRRAVDVVVIGAGVMGLSTASALAQDGRRVLLLEQFTIGHNRGSSHGASRIFRLSYPDPIYVEMAQESLELWRALEAASERDLVTVTGGLDLGEDIEANARALDARGAAHEMIDGKEAARRFPAVALEAGEPVLYHSDGGVIAADKTVGALAGLAHAGGAHIRENAPVTALEPSGDEVVIRLGEDSVRAPVCVITAGAWARELLATAGIDLDVRPTRETIAYFGEDRVEAPTLVEWSEPAAYSLPTPGLGLKVGEHHAGPTIDPGDPGGPDEESLARLSKWVGARYPGLDPAPKHAETCLYTNTPDESFVLERHGRIVVGSPCSGHGFKFAPLIGRRLADLASR